MQLEILLPFKVFATVEDVTRIVVSTRSGSFGLLPHRLDCVAALSPGLLSYSTAAGEAHLALDEGVLTKSGATVRVCVRHAIGGVDLGRLRQAVEQEFLVLNEQEKATRSRLAQLESGFVRRIVGLERA